MAKQGTVEAGFDLPQHLQNLSVVGNRTPGNRNAEGKAVFGTGPPLPFPCQGQASSRPRCPVPLPLRMPDQAKLELPKGYVLQHLHLHHALDLLAPRERENAFRDGGGGQIENDADGVGCGAHGEGI